MPPPCSSSGQRSWCGPDRRRRGGIGLGHPFRAVRGWKPAGSAPSPRRVTGRNEARPNKKGRTRRRGPCRSPDWLPSTCGSLAANSRRRPGQSKPRARRPGVPDPAHAASRPDAGAPATESPRRGVAVWRRFPGPVAFVPAGGTGEQPSFDRSRCRVPPSASPSAAGRRQGRQLPRPAGPRAPAAGVRRDRSSGEAQGSDGARATSRGRPATVPPPPDTAAPAAARARAGRSRCRSASTVRRSQSARRRCAGPTGR